jgi:acetyltransferase-like isoleucine patch superfamily enzyme
MSVVHAIPGAGGGILERMRRFGSRLRYDSIDTVGSGTVFAGHPDVVNDGSIEIGRNCRLGSRPIQSHLVAMPGARIVLGDDVILSYGSGISAMSEVHIGSGTRIGPFCLILDNDYHKAGDRDLPGDTAPVHVGRNVTIGAHVTLLRGARIGDGAHIMSGSCVSGFVAEQTVVCGVPARVAANEAARRYGTEVASVIARVFRMSTPLRVVGQLDSIPGWNPADTVRLMLALEEAFGVTLTQEDLAASRTVADIAGQVSRALG